MKFEKVVEKFKDRPFFELKEILSLTNESNYQIKNQFSYWTRQGKLKRLRQGKYILSSPYRLYTPSVYYISNYLCRPSYVSLHTALQFHGLIPEAVALIQAVTPRHGNEWSSSLGTFQYRSIKQERFWGYRSYKQIDTTHSQNSFLMAEPEKALLDLFYFQTGDWTSKRVKEMRFQNLEILDSGKFFSYAQKYYSTKVYTAAKNLFNQFKELSV